MSCLLDQGKIIKMLTGHGIKISKKELSEFLDENSSSISGLAIRPRGRGVDKPVEGRPHTYRWYDILSSNFDTDKANQHIVEHIRKHGLHASTGER